jgi:hypothetical protein
MKKSKDMLALRFIGFDGSTLLQCPLTSLPLRDDAVLRLSVEFFDDPEPCMIHRSAVMSRMYMELLEYFLHGLERGSSNFPIADMPERLASFFTVKGCHAITAKQL